MPGNINKRFIHKLQRAEEEADETLYFFELLPELNERQKTTMRIIYKEAEAILKIIISSFKTAKKKSGETGPGK